MAVGLTALNEMVVHRLEVLMGKHRMYSYQCQNSFDCEKHENVVPSKDFPLYGMLTVRGSMSRKSELQREKTLYMLTDGFRFTTFTLSEGGRL